MVMMAADSRVPFRKMPEDTNVPSFKTCREKTQNKRMFYCLRITNTVENLAGFLSQETHCDFRILAYL